MTNYWSRININFQTENGKTFKDPLNITERKKSLGNVEMVPVLKVLLENSNDLEIL